MRLTNTDRATFVVAIAVLVYLFGGTSIYINQDPPHTIEPAPLQPVRPPKPTQLNFGEGFTDTQVLRPKRIGTAETWEDPEVPGRFYTLRYLGVGIRELPDDALIPTDQEFADWLALPDEHPYADDLDAWLESVR